MMATMAGYSNQFNNSKFRARRGTHKSTRPLASILIGHRRQHERSNDAASEVQAVHGRDKIGGIGTGVEIKI
jgi:hypothetical protein